MKKTLSPYLLVIALLAMNVLVAAQAPPPKAASPAPPAKAPVPSTPRISDAMVQSLLKAYDGASTQFLGLIKLEGDSAHVYVSSARQKIAKKGYDLAGTTGKYNPPADARKDILTVSCGDEDRADLFECLSLKVIAGGRTVKPLLYLPSNDVYVNGFGVKWRAKKVYAEYAIASLVDGFTVQYTDSANVQWEYVVTSEDAGKELLLTMK